MDEKEFIEYLKCGLGRAVTFLRAADSVEREKYRAAVLDCCTHNYSYDAQCEGTRPVYKYELATCFDDPEYFISAVIAALDKADDDTDWQFKSLVDFLCVAACNLHPKLAKPALESKYALVYDMLINQPKRRKRRAVVDNTAEHYECLCIALCETDGMDGFIKVASDLGRLFGVSDYDADWFGWVLLFCEDKFGKDFVRERLTAESENNKYVAAYLASVNETIKQVTPPLPAERGVRKKIKESFDDERLKAVLDTVDNDGVTDPDDRHGLCLDILEACDAGKAVPFAALEYVYYSRCGICRCSAVKLMAERGILPDELARECLYDADTGLRAFVAGLNVN